MSDDLITRLRASLDDRYRIERELGAGGMATVYLAHDLKHDRKVAIKVLKPELAAVIGGARFLSEIRTTANLQHPHILSLHDSGEVDGTVFYVMPFVDGESLRDRLTRERQLPIDDALRIATEVADALQYAHEHGVIHRDIKPENILLHGGHALVADFGIALAASSTGGSRMTETGMSLGTPAYMSPEQAMGERSLDARTDVYALGCVLYEMLVGDPPFIGSTAQAIVAKVLTEKPPRIITQRDRVPVHVEATVLTALEKLSADRFGSAKEFTAALRDSTRTTTYAAASSSGGARSGLRTALAMGAVTLVAGLLIGRFVMRPAATTEGVRAYSIALPDSLRVAFQGNVDSPGGHGSVVISPDARRVAWIATGPSGVRLAVRELDAYTVRVLPGTDGAYAPFFSADGGTIGYFSGRELRTISLATGESRVLNRDLKEPDGAVFLTDGRIIYTTQYQGVFVVSPNGETRSLNRPSQTTIDLPAFPSTVPGDPYVLAVSRGSYVIGALDVSTGRFRPFERFDAATETDTTKRFLTGSAPHIAGDRLFWLDGDVLMSARFDISATRITSASAPVVRGVRGDLNGAADFAVARDGTIVFVPGGDPAIGRLAWLDANRRVDTLPLPAANYSGWDVAPDAQRIVTRLKVRGEPSEFHILDLVRGSDLKLPISAPFSSQAVWMPDGRSILLSVAGSPQDSGAIIRVSADGSTRIDTLMRAFASRYTTTRDGRVAVELRPPTAYSGVARLAVSENGQPFTLLRHGSASTPMFSPDGRWLAFEEEQGHAEVFLEPFPANGNRYQVSADGGYEAIFSKNGDRIFYRRARSIMSASFAPGDPPRIGKPTEYVTFDFADFSGRAWMLAPDGRFLIKLLPSDAPQPEIRVLSGALTATRTTTTQAP